MMINSSMDIFKAYDIRGKFPDELNKARRKGNRW